MKFPFNYINTRGVIWYKCAEDYAQYLKSMRSHFRTLSAEKKRAAKAKREAYAVPKIPKHWSWRLNAKGTGVLTIRGRKPPYLTTQEYAAICAENPDHIDILNATMARRKIGTQDE